MLLVLGVIGLAYCVTSSGSLDLRILAL